MNTPLFVLLLAILSTGCEEISPFVSDTLWDKRMDRDQDKIPRPQDCNDRDPNPKASIRVWYRDLDKDGLGAGEKIIACDQPADTTVNNADCDDVHASVYPNAPELCDQLDNDCDGQTDENAVDQGTYYKDQDEDTYGTLVDPKITCFLPPGYVLNHSDCRDDLKAVHPNAIETCNEIDDDCDSQTDEAFSNLGASCGTGACAGGTIQCTSDHLNTVCTTDGNKGTEICDDLDNDCDSQTDEGVKLTFYTDADQDTFGWKASEHFLCAPLPNDVTNALDCDDAHTNAHPSGTEICDSLDNNCNGQTDEPTAVNAKTLFADVDQDSYGNLLVTKKSCAAESGWSQTSDDCNDLDKFVHPNAVEKCNNVDDNCNGQTDEGVLITYYLDSDTDGYGNLSKDVTGCTTPNGYVTNSDDCNDGKKTIHPNAIELCDNKIDENCDGVTDNAIEASLWYLDTDKDGYGNAAISIYACATPTGSVASKTDCDDANPLIHPNAIEICKDGIDNDCNGVTDTDTKIVTWYLDSDKDGFGDAKQSKQDCSQPPGYVENATDCSDTNASIHPGVLEVCNNGVDDNCDGSVNQCKLTSGTFSAETSQTVIYGNANKLYLNTFITLDLNGDKKQDLAIGVKDDDAKGNNAGAIYLFLGPITSDTLSLDDANLKWTGETPGDEAGFSLGSGDVNGDGKDDLLIGAPKKNAGVTYLILGSTNIVGGSLSNTNLKWTGETPGDQYGYSLSLGDTNNDGKTDVLVGAPSYSTPISHIGSAYLFLGSANPTGGNPSNAAQKWIGETNDDRIGYAIKIADVNNDGAKDVLLGTPYKDKKGVDIGSVYILLNPFAFTSAFLSEKNAIVWKGEAPLDQAGYSIETADIDGDNKIDIFVGSPQHDKGGSDAGAVYMISGINNLETTNLNNPFIKWIGENVTDQFGSSIKSGDLNNDGYSDILVSAPYQDFLFENGGAVYIFHGLGF